MNLSMNRPLLFLASLVTVSLNLAAAAPAPQWKATENISNPESAYFDAGSKKIFVSNVAGAATDKDGKGWISVITVDAKGKPTVTKLVDGLNAPKGIRVQNGALWVSDIDELVKIDLKSGKIAQRVAVPGAKFLNDVAIDTDGTVYVSDMLASKIYAVKDGKPSVFVEGNDLESPNGLLIHDGKLVVATWGLITDPATFGVKVPGNILTIDLKTKARAAVTKTPLGNLDGLEVAANGDFLTSDWVAGKVYRVTAQGVATLIADGFKNAADIGIEGNTLLVPAMSGNEVIALGL